MFETIPRVFPYDPPDRLTKYSATETILTSATIIWKPGLTQQGREPVDENVTQGYKAIDLITDDNVFTWECNQPAFFPSSSLSLASIL